MWLRRWPLPTVSMAEKAARTMFAVANDCAPKPKAQTLKHKLKEASCHA